MMSFNEIYFSLTRKRFNAQTPPNDEGWFLILMSNVGFWGGNKDSELAAPIVPCSGFLFLSELINLILEQLKEADEYNY